MHLRTYLRALRRRWLTIVVCLVLAVGFAAAVTFTSTKQYASSALLFVSNSQAGTDEALQVTQLTVSRITSYADLVDTRVLADRVADDLELGDVDREELAEDVEAEPVPDTVLLEVTFTDPDPARAQRLAQAYADGLSDLIAEIETPAPGVEAAPIQARVVEEAALPEAPVSPRPARNLVLGALLGLVVAVSLTVVRELLDTTIKSEAEATEVAGVAAIGSIPHDPSYRTTPLISDLEQHAARVEAFRTLRTNLQFVDIDSPAKVIVVSSALPQEGKSSTSVNLAIALARAGQRTLLVDSDLRRPRATELFGLDPGVGLTSVLLGHVPLSEAIQRFGSFQLGVLASGPLPPNPAELLQTKAMAKFVAQLRGEFDVVVLDAPPLLPVTDAALLASMADGALLVVRHGRTRTDHLAQAVNALTSVGAAPVGLVLNDTPRRSRQSGYHYGYGYGYLHESGGRRTTSGRRRKAPAKSAP